MSDMSQQTDLPITAVLDVGTTSVRCFVYSSNFKILSTASKDIEILIPQHGYNEIDPEKLYCDCVYVIKKAVRDANCSFAEIVLGISTLRSSFTTWNKTTGKTYHRICTWNDIRADDLVRKWNKSFTFYGLHLGAGFLYFFTRSQKFLAGSVLKLTNTQVTPRLLWCLENIPELKEGIKLGEAVFGTIESFLLYRLKKGNTLTQVEHVSDMTNAIATGLYDPFTLSWGDWAFKMFKINRNIMPKVVDNSYNFGSTHSSVFGVPVKISAVIADQAASIFGNCVFSKGNAKLTLGTGTFLSINTANKCHASICGLYPQIAYSLHETGVIFDVEGNSNDTAMSILWGMQIGLYNDPSETSDMAESVCDSDGVYFIPAFNGLSAPINDFNASTGFIGIKPSTTKYHMVRAILQSIVFRVAQLIRAASKETNYVIRQVKADGGVSKNDFVLQSLADLCDLSVARSNAESTSLGVAYLSCINMRAMKIDDVKKQYKPLKVFLPKTKNKEDIIRDFCEWERAVERFKSCTSVAQNFLECDYQLEDSTYTCILSISNPNGFDNWTTIDGNHLEGFTNADVVNLRASYQTTTNIPQIICSTFMNLTTISFAMSQIRTISPNTFTSCSNLVSLRVFNNFIEDLPDSLFINNGNLRSIDFTDNRITQFGANTFLNTVLESIMMDYNEITTFETAWFLPINSTLKSLSLHSNQITKFPDSAFTHFNQLESLSLSANYLSDLPNNAFDGLENLQVLSLYGNLLTILKFEWFNPLTNLVSLRLEFNTISDLPSGIFNNNNRLTDLGLSFNQLSEINSNSFGDLNNLVTFYGEFNMINSIDSEFFDRAINLNGLYLTSNICTQSSFYDVALNRISVRLALQTCFDNFNVETTLECFYLAAEFFPYTCELTIVNPQGRDDFETIDGDHVEENGDNDVLRLEAFNQNTFNLPSVLCDRFNNLQEITITGSRMELLTSKAFENCRELTYLDLEHNNITALEEGLFDSNPLLEILNLNDNHIATIGLNTFVGTQLWYIDLEHNQLNFFTPNWFNPINSTLRSLNLNGNFITNLPSQAFSILRNLEELEIAANSFVSIPGNSFEGLTNLGYLAMYRCNIEQLLPEWFADLSALHSLHIETNNITVLPQGIFNSLQRLNDINLSQNQLTTIDSRAFGNVSAFVAFNAQFNQINAINPEFFDLAEVLYILFLNGNTCVSTNFINVVGTRELVRNQLLGCFENFLKQERGIIECEYVDDGIFGYVCEMKINNPRGSDDFERIEGTHIEGFTDSDVFRVEAYQQISTLVPAIICIQFINLRQLYLGASNIKNISSTAFENCLNLEYLNLELNLIQQIPSNLFINSPHLVYLSFLFNEITLISPNAFENTIIEDLKLDDNQLTAIDLNWFNGITETLQFLTISENLITELSENQFSSLIKLRELDLGRNSLVMISDTAFDGLRNLEYLWLYHSTINEVNPIWFSEMPSLQGVHINYNQLTNLPNGLFRNNHRLFELNVAGNRIRIVDSNIFGNLSSLLYLTASNNRIMAIDSQFFDQATQIYNLFLFNNLCTSQNFISIVNNRSEIRNQLSNCFDIFEREGLLQCTYIEDDFLPYRCEFEVQNIAGNDNFERIEGLHVGSRNDNDVLRLESFGQQTFNIPRIICNQFNNLEEIYFAFAGIEVLTSESFSSCNSLNYLNLELNDIAIINSGVLNNLVNLASLSFYGNQLIVIESQAFQNLPLTYLNLDVNRLSYINPEWFVSGSQLTYLTIASNEIVSLPSRGFSNAATLQDLILSNNELNFISIDSFEGLTNLNYLILNNCSIKNINPIWFENLNSLQRLYLQGNNIESLPQRIFNNLTHINLAGNQLRAINRNAFVAIESLIQFNAQNNMIDGIETSFFDEASSLYTLQLLNNLCTSNNFINIPMNRENVREQLSICFENFESTEINCNYMYDFPYTCYFTIFNPLSRNDFNNIPGIHMSGREDENVESLDANNQLTNVFPEVICRQFTNLNYIYFLNSGIEILTADTFSACTKLLTLTLDGNRIAQLIDNLFINSPNLALISLAFNNINHVSENSLTGINLVLLDLEQNEISEIPNNFLTSSTNLYYLILNENRLTNLPNGLFTGLNLISFLDISHNQQLSDLPDNFFNGLAFLMTLVMDHCNFTSLNPNWFHDLSNINNLFLSDNPIDQLPIGVFNPLFRVDYLAIDNMNLERLDANSFGAALRNVRVIRARGNRINAIDPRILDNSIGNLNEFYLLNNVCIDNNFSGVQANIEEVRQDLYRCFANFE
ncbi:hypothetical protein PVAND_014415 [Polypedilum vanderplanki]|uniref:Glycerol kinase 5 n=1 Tax=Polypedilum vanderplanki TaxID=319348 RepID=A0A9J6B9K3_POLVA|nr:hypothetical protein PVAND_014415 [Polypedilum vanderplanki]